MALSRAAELEAAVAVAEGRISVPFFDASTANQPAKLALTHGGTIVRIQRGDTWAVTRQSLARGTGSFSFELVGDKSGDEISCFGVVQDGHLGALPLAVQEAQAPAGSCYLRSYNGKVADESSRRKACAPPPLTCSAV